MISPAITAFDRARTVCIWAFVRSMRLGAFNATYLVEVAVCCCVTPILTLFALYHVFFFFVNMGLDVDMRTLQIASFGANVLQDDSLGNCHHIDWMFGFLNFFTVRTGMPISISSPVMASSATSPCSPFITYANVRSYIRSACGVNV